MSRKTSLTIFKINFLIVDIGFIIYWLITYMNWIPDEFLFTDYKNPLLVIWNWSFFPIDILISITGFITLYLLKIGNPLWQTLAKISLTLTFASGFVAISFWIIQGFYDPSWWLPNLYLATYPILCVVYFYKKKIFI